jgi:hypothetical protein
MSTGAFYSFAEGEVARHIPRVWDVTTPEAAHAARERCRLAAQVADVIPTVSA